MASDVFHSIDMTRGQVSRIAVRRGYEPSAISAKWPALFVMVLVISAGLIFGGTWLLPVRFTSGRRAVDEPLSAVSRPQVFTGANLQPSIGHERTPREDLANLRAKENRTFQKMGWTIDGESGEAIIPDRVIAELNKRGRP